MNTIINYCKTNTLHSVIRQSVAVILFALFVSVLFSCYTPSPLYGTWADNAGSSISFQSDGSFNATIVNSAGTSKTYSGTYSVTDNVLVLTKDSGASINTEWDIRGSLLYLVWTDDEGVSQSLTLYHTAS